MNRGTVPSAAELLAADGPIAAALNGFEERAEQREMAAAIASVIEGQGVLVCEAGTGTGKTLAYLVPALVSGRRTIISTATRTLQDQLFHRDLPLVRRALGHAGKVALLKGRQNYLCLHRLNGALADPALDHRYRPRLEWLLQWAERTRIGDLEEAALPDDEGPLLGAVTSTTDNCLGQDCPLYDKCFVLRARRAAAAADLVVVNHHLLFADLVLRETGFAELLPNAEVVILDEAHKVPDIASAFFSQSVSTQQVAALARDGRRAAEALAADTPALAAAFTAAEQAARWFCDALGDITGRCAWPALAGRESVATTLAGMAEALDRLRGPLEGAAERNEEFAALWQRASSLALRWSIFGDVVARGHVQWLDVSARGATLYDTPVSVATEFAARVTDSDAAWIMTSATLAVDGSFDHFRLTLGLDEAEEHLWASPFDYAANALLYVPPLALEPRDPGYEEALVDAVVPVLRASRGRAFFLFTSYRALELAARLLAARTSFPLYVQGSASRRDLLARFQRTENAVLLGTASFWEGIDVRGEQLSCVIIDKLPFGVPDDPVMRARGEALEAEGGNPFMALQLPEAVTALKQGAGRLIRDSHDRGVLVIGDNRVLRRRYGQAFIRSLPPIPLTRELDDVTAFFAPD